MVFQEVKYRSRVLRPRKAITNPDFSSETVLVEDPWDYVDLWLKRKKHLKAREYWLQAREFAEAARALPPTSAPLPAYYCFLNATKCLLKVRGEDVSPDHGVSGSKEGPSISLDSERVNFKSGGVLAGLCRLLGEPTTKVEYSLRQALYNLPYIHRANSLTFTSMADLYIPIRNLRFVRIPKTTEAWLCADVEERYNSRHTANKLPSTWEFDEGVTGKGTIRMKSRFKWDAKAPNSKANMKRLMQYHMKARKDISYIVGVTRLWYIKRGKIGEHYVNRSPMSLTFAAMHRLSELSRYDPLTLREHLNRRHNWLVSEFIKIAPRQFIDEVASEITGCDFLAPGSRM